MYKLVAGLASLAIGLLIFAGYVTLLSNEWYIRYSTEMLLMLLSQVPSVKSWAINAEFIDLQLVFTLIQVLVLSGALAMVFSLLLVIFTGLIRYVHFAILGVFIGFMYLISPALMAFVSSGFLTNGMAPNPVLTQPLVQALVWYLPFMVTIFICANMKRRQHALAARRSWFH